MPLVRQFLPPHLMALLMKEDVIVWEPVLMRFSYDRKPQRRLAHTPNTLQIERYFPAEQPVKFVEPTCTLDTAAGYRPLLGPIAKLRAERQGRHPGPRRSRDLIAHPRAPSLTTPPQATWAAVARQRHFDSQRHPVARFRLRARETRLEIGLFAATGDVPVPPPYRDLRRSVENGLACKGANAKVVAVGQRSHSLSLRA